MQLPAAEAEEAEDSGETEAAADPIVAVAEVAVKMVARSKQTPTNHAIGAQSTLTFLLESGRGVNYITDGGEMLIFVLSQLHVRGRTLLHQNNETGTSPAVTYLILLT